MSCTARDYQTLMRDRLIESRLTPNAISLTGFALCVVAAALVESVAGEQGRDWPLARSLAATGWSDMTRLAKGDPEMGAGILATNGPAVAAALRAMRDALDGWIARRNKEVTTFGKLMDPLADKLLVTSALVSLVSLDRLQAWVAMVIIAREFAVTGLRQLAMEHGEVIPASMWGKVKTIFQIAMVLVLITVEGSPFWVDALVAVTTIITVISGADYFFGFRSLVQARQARRAPG